MDTVFKRNIGIIVAMLGAPVTTAIMMTLPKSIYACDASALCGDIRNGFVLAVGIALAFVAARIVHRAATGERLW